MSAHTPSNRQGCCPGITRRSFLLDTGMGFTGLALSAMLFRDGALRADEAHAPPDGRPHFEPKARSVIWIFLCGGVSHVESFDPKPVLNRYAGQTIDNTPYRDALNPERLRDVIAGNPSRGGRRTLMGLNTGVRRYGQSGLAVADWWRHVGACADDLAVVRSLWTVHNDHGAQLTWHTGRHPREGPFPTIGSWVSYGLGTLNRNLPEYVVLGTPTGDCCGGSWTHGAAYLGPELSGIDYPDDPALRARIRAYETAFGMQTAVPETLQLERETAQTQRLYGIDQNATRPFGQLCLAARRLVERGVRFVQIFHGGGGGGAWDAPSGIRNNHGNLSAQVDLPIAGLLKDLKRRGMLSDTLVVWGTEFGRSP